MQLQGTLRLFLISALSCMCFSSISHSKDSAPPSNKQGNPPVQAAPSQNQKFCDDIEKIFSIPKNREYISSTNTIDFSQLSIPESIKTFEVVEWKNSTEDEFKSKLPIQYEQLKNYMRRTDSKKHHITDVRKVNLDVYNRSVNNELYRIIYDTNAWQNYLFEPDAIRRGFKKIFDNNAAESEPFIYKKGIFFLKKRNGNITIAQYRSIKQRIPPVKILCTYDMQK